MRLPLLFCAALAACSSDSPPSCDAEIAALEGEMRAALDAAALDPAVTADPDFTVLLETPSGRRFAHAHGASSATTRYESASTSKLVAAVVLLDLVDAGRLSLSSRPHDLISFWEEDQVTLRDLLSFTSGFADEPLCVNLPGADFEQCVRRIHDDNRAGAAPPGSEFAYSSAHMQVAGLMAVRATGAAGFAEVFDAWRQKTGLFPTGAFDLPSLENPRLAGGMHWTAAEYLDFLRALARGELLAPATQAALFADQRGAAVVVASPAGRVTGEDWSYGLGNWLECRSASFDCGAGHRNSSPGAYGAYPFIDFDHGYFGIVARQGGLGTGFEGVAIARSIEAPAARWAAVTCD
jgi:CubicO group peptidase (beta-lactamase class C family)